MDCVESQVEVGIVGTISRSLLSAHLRLEGGDIRWIQWNNQPNRSNRSVGPIEAVSGGIEGKVGNR